MKQACMADEAEERSGFVWGAPDASDEIDVQDTLDKAFNILYLCVQYPG